MAESNVPDNVQQFAKAAEEKLRQASGQDTQGSNPGGSEHPLTDAEIREANAQVKNPHGPKDHLVDIGRANQTTGRE